MHKIRVAVLRGGPSNEYDASLNTGSTVLRNLKEDIYDGQDILISKDGVWHKNGSPSDINTVLSHTDVVWNALHGHYGEDGKLAHILEVHRIPFTGSKSFASAIGMNKLMTKDVLKKNKIKRKISISNKDASQFLLENSAMDYIDIDPFGTPNPFLDSAVKRITNEGILAVTATDTAPLCGTYPEACLRKYWAVSKRSPIMHETGLRILIRKVQLIGAQYQKALVPLYAYAKEHYFRAFFSCKKSKAECQRLLQQHGMLNDIGPLWKGALWDSDFAKKVTEKADKKDKETSKFTETIVEESSIRQ